MAIIDSGIDGQHIDLDIKREFVLDGDDTEDPAPHGTHVAGIVAAKRNGIGMHGVAYNAELVNMKIAPDDFSDANQLQDDGVIAAAIASVAGVDRTYDRPGGETISTVNGAEADVMNMSFTTGDPTFQVLEAMRDAAAEEKIMVIALGNDFNAFPTPTPAAYVTDPDIAGYGSGRRRTRFQR